MTYPALPDRRMPYDNDGTVVYALGDTIAGFTSGTGAVQSDAALASLNGTGLSTWGTGGNGAYFAKFFWFFPEQREVTACFAVVTIAGNIASSSFVAQGSNNSTNGLDGTWESATFPSGSPLYVDNSGVWGNVPVDVWRSSIKPVSFTGAKQVVRTYHGGSENFGTGVFIGNIFHLYGAKAAGQTPNDLLFLDAQNADAVFTAPIDFGDRPLGTTAVHQFKVQNASATLTAHSINLQCNDADFAISTDGVTYVATINITSLAASAKSAVMYVRDTTPNPGGALGPRYARIVATVASYS